MPEPDNTPASPEIAVDRSNVKSGAATAFIICYLYCVCLWLCPDCAFRSAMLSPAMPWMEFLGLTQNFVTFAPNPEKTNMELVAIIQYNDGSQSTWDFPRAESYHGYDRMVKDKYRRFLHRHLVEGRMLAPLANYIARQCDCPTKHPVNIRLVEHWTPVSLPNSPVPPFHESVLYDQPLVGP